MSRETLTLPTETVERVTDALNAILTVRDGQIIHRAALEKGSAALRELATMTSAALGIDLPGALADAQEQVKALEESRERLTSGIAALQQRNAELERRQETDLRAVDALRETCAKVLRSLDHNLAEGYLPETREALRAALAGTETLKAEPRFMFTTDANNPTGPVDFAPLSEMLSANRDDADFCEYLRAAEVGRDPWMAGGGAAPAFWTWRVA